MRIFRQNVVLPALLCMVLFTVSCGARKGTPNEGNQTPSPPAAPLQEEQKQSETAPPAEPPKETAPSPSPSPEPAKDPEKPKESKKASKEVLIGSYHTTILNKDKDRVNNIVLAADEINGYIVKPGQIFSFNEVVGKRISEKGYEKAKIIVNGKYEEDIGGGVCQMSSTLYNAAEKAGMEIVERNSHSAEVHYVPKGKDAAVTYEGLDFKFKNTKDYPVKIKAWVSKGKVYASIYRVK